MFRKTLISSIKELCNIIYYRNNRLNTFRNYSVPQYVKKKIPQIIRELDFIIWRLENVRKYEFDRIIFGYFSSLSLVPLKTQVLTACENYSNFCRDSVRARDLRGKTPKLS